MTASDGTLPDDVQPPTEGGTGTAEVPEGLDDGAAEQEEAAGGAAQHGRGRVD